MDRMMMQMRPADDRGEVCVVTALPSDPVLAMAYVPFQMLERTYEPEQALQTGTLFPELNKPFRGREVEPR